MAATKGWVCLVTETRDEGLGLPGSVRIASSRVLAPRLPVASPRAGAFESKVDAAEPGDGGGQIVDESANPRDERLEAQVGR